MASLAVRRTAHRLVVAGRRFDARGWVLGTSGNFSAVLNRSPMRLLITPSASRKGQLSGAELLEVDDTGQVVERARTRPSAETLLHVVIATDREAGAVLHTHSVWGTILSDRHAGSGGLAIAGFEMLKGLSGVSTHEHREWIPIMENDQDMPRLAAEVRRVLERYPDAHGFLLRGHGLYTWGRSIDEAERHVEILEFLLEVVGRGDTYGHRHHS